LLSHSTTVRLGLLLEQDLRRALRSDLFAVPRSVSASNEWEPDALAYPCGPNRLTSESALEEVGDRVFELAVILDGADLDRPHQLIG
jgi:hypothetical protein